MSLDLCEDCGSYAPLILVALFWAAPLACIAVRRHVGSDSEKGQGLRPLIWILTAMALWMSWQYVTSWWF